MPDVGLPEILIILVIVLLLFGAKRLPQLGRSLGQSISGFKKGLNEVASPDEEEQPEIGSSETKIAATEISSTSESRKSA